MYKTSLVLVLCIVAFLWQNIPVTLWSICWTVNALHFTAFPPIMRQEMMSPITITGLIFSTTHPRCAAQCTIHTKREMGKSRKFSYCRLCRLSHWFEGVDFSEDFSHYAVVGDLLAVTMGFFRRQRVHINNECNRQQKCHSILQWRFGSQGGRPALLSPSLEAFLPSQCTSKPQRSYCGDCEWTTLGWQKHIFYFPRDNNQSVHPLV